MTNDLQPFTRQKLDAHLPKRKGLAIKEIANLHNTQFPPVFHSNVGSTFHKGYRVYNLMRVALEKFKAAQKGSMNIL
ncbi:hypothetical protein KIN20_009571 [Parelaphostrongylus tenuis]|uniref:Uncharacterized protein n=1 Tax=Parelaphostrongylus tenuis TaxID=148309 RepID=A0AAD5MP82_PARTN|nr:hypothetical protein KIN20_009571 [Parelaphostrongylus tenuis]